MHLAGDRTLTVHRNDVVRERCSPSAVGRSSCRIVDGRVCAEIARANVGSRHSEKAIGGSAFPHAFPSAEEEQLVAQDGAAKSSAIHIAAAAGLLAYLEEVAGLEVVIGVIAKRGTMELIRSGLGHNCDRSAAG